MPRYRQEEKVYEYRPSADDVRRLDEFIAMGLYDDEDLAKLDEYRALHSFTSKQVSDLTEIISHAQNKLDLNKDFELITKIWNLGRSIRDAFFFVHLDEMGQSVKEVASDSDAEEPKTPEYTLKAIKNYQKNLVRKSVTLDTRKDSELIEKLEGDTMPFNQRVKELLKEFYGLNK